MICSYYYRGPEGQPWEFEETSWERINLLVGASGSGKTKFTNTLFNFASSVVKGEPFRNGFWRIVARTASHEYLWEYDGGGTQSPSQVVREFVKRKDISATNGYEVIVNRKPDEFLFCGDKLPKLQKDKSSITLLKEEDTIRPLYETFGKVQRRSFHTEGLRDALSIENLPVTAIKKAKEAGLEELWKQEHTVSAKMFLLKENFQTIYRLAVDVFTSVFTTITECDVRPMKSPPLRLSPEAVIPEFVVKEKNVGEWIPLRELSSGMQKVLLIVTDVLTLPKGSIYIIDEYENSLGINAIDFLPDFLLHYGEDVQFFITTHHPYLINSMPMKTWRVFHRTGCKVAIKPGAEFEKKYGRSKQKAFVQLINDPFYTGIAE